MAEEATDASLGEILYERCNKDAAASKERLKKTYNQDALLALCAASEGLEHIIDARALMPLVQYLSSTGLFIVLKTKSGTCWGLRPRDAATKMLALTGDERTVYSLIEEAHEGGTWIRALKTKIGIKDGKAMDKMLASLQRKNLIKNVTNIKSTGKKYYMLAHLVPGDDVTGGSFYENGELDESFLENLRNLIVFHVRQMSWVEERKKRIKRETSPIVIRDDNDDHPPAVGGAQEAAARKKRKRDPTATKDIEDAAPPRKHRVHRHSHDTEGGATHTQVAFPAGHSYPKADSIHEYITSCNIINGAKAQQLSVDEVQTVINVLVWDGKLEEVNGGYRSVRGVKFKHPDHADDAEEELPVKRGNGFTEMPCGRCPVLDICGNGGPINAESCVYFDKWLGVGAAGEVF